MENEVSQVFSRNYVAEDVEMIPRYLTHKTRASYSSSGHLKETPSKINLLATCSAIIMLWVILHYEKVYTGRKHLVQTIFKDKKF